MTSRPGSVLALLSVLVALAVPAFGSAAVYYPATGGGGDGGGSGEKGPEVCNTLKPGKCSPGPDAKAPQTEILKGPKGKIAKTTVMFKFKASEKGGFRCKLDRGPYRVCKSPKTYEDLKPGKHVFKVRAIDRAGNIDPTAAKRRFFVLP